jgi:hypothetical protein
MLCATAWARGAKRSDQVASELAQHDYRTDVEAKAVLETLATDFAAMAARHEELHRHFTELVARLDAGPAAATGDPSD